MEEDSGKTTAEKGKHHQEGLLVGAENTEVGKSRQAEDRNIWRRTVKVTRGHCGLSRH
jgi:hypothetical protein